MKIYILSFVMMLACFSSSFGQYPIGSYILQTSSTDPANTHTHLYTQWRYNTQDVGFVGYGSSNGVLYLHNHIGDVNIQSSHSSGNILFNLNNKRMLSILSDGKVAIGRDIPRWTLDVEGIIGGKQALWLKTNSNQSTEIVLEKPNESYYAISGNNSAFMVYNHSTQKNIFEANAADNVGIGIAPVAGYRLAVGGALLAEKVKVKQLPWPDYVFEPGYQLPSLTALEAYVKAHKHLPGVPSAKEVSENGLDMGSTQAALLEKIEELTLIIIEQNKKLDEQEKRLKAVEKKLR